MDLFIEIIGGEPRGKRFVLVNGFKLGRKNCEILIADPKVSSLHATIFTKGSGADQKYFLKDNNSSNGIKFNDLRVPELFLAPGVEFRLGNTVFRVVAAATNLPAPPKEVRSPQSEPLPKIVSKAPDRPRPEKPIIVYPEKVIVPADLPTPMAQPAPLDLPPEVEAPPQWRDLLKKLLEVSSMRASDSVTEMLGAFNPPLRLRCVRGRQYGKSWIFGYGPRQVGPKSLDLVLIEAAAPPICFNVAPVTDGVEFKTQYPDVVRVNGQKLTRAALHEGDIIEILNSQLMVEFENA